MNFRRPGPDASRVRPRGGLLQPEPGCAVDSGSDRGRNPCAEPVPSRFQPDPAAVARSLPAAGPWIRRRPCSRNLTKNACSEVVW